MIKKYNFNGIRVFDYGGKNSPLIFIHAFPLSSRMWENQVEYFKNSYRIITYDIRGLGNSIVEDNQYTMENMADDLLNTIRFLKLENVILCGLSMGGYIILRAILKKPENIRAIILADTKAEKDDNPGLLARSFSINNIKAGHLKKFKSDLLTKLICKANLNNKELVKFVSSMMTKQTPDGLCGATIAIATRINTIDHLKEIKIPVLILVGENDELTPVIFAKRMKSKIKNSKLIIQNFIVIHNSTFNIQNS